MMGSFRTKKGKVPQATKNKPYSNPTRKVKGVTFRNGEVSITKQGVTLRKGKKNKVRSKGGTLRLGPAAISLDKFKRRSEEQGVKITNEHIRKAAELNIPLEDYMIALNYTQGINKSKAETEWGTFHNEQKPVHNFGVGVQTPFFGGDLSVHGRMQQRHGEQKKQSGLEATYRRQLGDGSITVSGEADNQKNRKAQATYRRNNLGISAETETGKGSKFMLGFKKKL